MRNTSYLAACLALLVAGTIRADDEKKPRPGPTAAQLEATYKDINQYVTKNYIGKLPGDWATWSNRFDGRLTTNGHLRAATVGMLSSPSDLQLELVGIQKADELGARLVGGYIGLGISFKFDVRLQNGFKINQILTDSPANKAGVKPGTIVAIDGQRLHDMQLVDAAKLLMSPSTERKLTINYDDKETEYVIKRKEGEKMGIAFGREATLMTVTVEQVLPNSPAERSGVRVGDKVTHVNKNDLKNADQDWFIGQASYGRYDTTISITVAREDGEKLIEMPRSIVENVKLGFDFTAAAPGTKTTIRLTNLDWPKVVQLLDERIPELKKENEFVIDLRGASGEDPELAARIAARFIGQSDDLITSIERRDGTDVTVAYRIAAGENGQSALVLDGKVKEQPRDVVSTGKIEVLVDGLTSGTAEALARALQVSGRATVTGTRTAGRDILVSTQLFTYGDNKIRVQVPTKRLVDNNLKTFEINPNADKEKAQYKAAFNTMAVSIILILAAGVIGSRVLYRLVKERPLARKTIPWIPIVAALIGAGFGGHYLRPKTNNNVTKAQEAANYVNNFLRTNPEVREDRLQHARVERGPRDAESSKFGSNITITDAEIESACKIVTYVTEGDADAIRNLVVNHAYMPFARAQFGSALDYSLYGCGIEGRTIWYRPNGFGLEFGRPDDGTFYVMFSPLDEEPEVVVWVENGSDRGHSGEKSDLLTYKEAVNIIKLEFIRGALAHKAGIRTRP